MSVLETQGLTKEFGDLRAVDGMDFEVDSGEIVGIIGPNGAGKTTFVNLLTGVLDATSGEIVFDGKSLQGSPVHDRARAGLVRSFQIPRVCDDLTLVENVRSAILSQERKNNSLFTVLDWEDDTRAEAVDLLEEFGLAEKRETEAEAIPHGDKKILDVCMSVAMRPKLLILDEPTSGVATENKYAIMDRLRTTSRPPTRAVLFIEHDMELVADYAERVVAMDQGAEAHRQDAGEVLEDQTVKQRIRGEGDVARTRRRRRLDRGGITVLRGIDLAVDESETVGIIGRNGAGKTSTFRSVMGLQTVQQGPCPFRGEDITNMPTHERKRLGIGFAPGPPAHLEADV